MRFAAIVVLAGTTVFCAGRTTAERRFLTIATGGTGGVYYVYGGGLANLLGKWIPGVEASAEATAASVDNLKLIAAGRAELAFTLADTAVDAFKGQGRFQAPVDLRVIARLYDNYTHLVTLESSRIRSVADLRGRRVSIGAPGSGTEIIALRMLEAAGLAPSDLVLDRLGVSESAGALKDRRIDAFVWSGGLPTSAVQDLARSPAVRIRLVDTAELIPALVDRFGPLYFPLVIPATFYGTPGDARVIGVANLLVTRADFDEELAYQITRGMFEHKADLAAVHPEAAKLGLETAVSGTPIPLHPGAARYYREQRVIP